MLRGVVGEQTQPGVDIPDYYSSEALLEKYESKVDAGLTEVEETVVERYFTDTDATVLDIGCATGRTTAVLDRMGYEVVGIDLTEPALERARAHVPDAEFLLGDVRSLPFDDETFDYALFSYNGIDDIAPEEDRYRALREIHRVLNASGIFTFSTHNLWSTYVVRSPDLVGLRQYVRFWIRNVRQGRLFSRYKSDPTVRGEPRPLYYIRPSDQKQQLRNCGFEVRDVIRPDGLLTPYFHHPYYVAQKPARNRTVPSESAVASVTPTPGSPDNSHLTN